MLVAVRVIKITWGLSFDVAAIQSYTEEFFVYLKKQWIRWV